MSKVSLALRGEDNATIVRDIALTIIRNQPKNQQISVKNDSEKKVVRLKIQLNSQMDESISDIITSSEIIEFSFDGVENEKTKKTRPKTEQRDDDSEYEQLNFADDCNEKNSEESLKDFNIEGFSELKDIISSAKTEDDLAEEISVFFDISDNDTITNFKKLFITSLTLLKLSWTEIESKMGEKVTKSEKSKYSRRIKDILKKYGYKSANTIDVIRQICDYYKYCYTKFKLPCMQGIERFEIELKSMDLGWSNNLKLVMIFETFGIVLSNDEIYHLLLAIYDSDIKSEKEAESYLNANELSKMTGAVNSFLMSHGKDPIELIQFLRELKQTGILNFK